MSTAYAIRLVIIPLFSHILRAHSAGYYSYKWAEVLSADIFSAFEELGLESEVLIKQLGKKFRESYLALGGSVEPMNCARA